MWTREVQFDRVTPFVLAGDGEILPVLQLRVVPRPGHDRGDKHMLRKRLLDPAEPRHPRIQRLVGNELPVPRGVQRRSRALFHREMRGIGIRAQKLCLGPRDVDDRVQSNGLRHDAAPASLEGSKNVRFRFSWRRRRQQKRILKSNPGKRRRKVDGHRKVLRRG